MKLSATYNNKGNDLLEQNIKGPMSKNSNITRIEWIELKNHTEYDLDGENREVKLFSDVPITPLTDRTSQIDEPNQQVKIYLLSLMALKFCVILLYFLHWISSATFHPIVLTTEFC